MTGPDDAADGEMIGYEEAEDGVRDVADRANERLNRELDG